ncbi:MAG TPA: ATP-binding protein [Nitrososphaeraceae archaeon]|nr:ATP-binding protein [Nitrososphaeraceae archaeon]
MNYTRPQLAIILEPVKKAFFEAKNKAVKIRYLTEITPENISYCKEMMSIVDELRHLDGIKGNFMLSELEYLAPVILFEKEKIASQIIYSNIKELVEQQQFVFDSFWSRAIPAQQKIREIEEGIVPIRTRLLEKQDEIIKEIKRKNNAANKLSICTGFGGMQMSYNYLFDSYNNVVDKSKKKGGAQEEDSGLRWITNIDRASLNLVKKFLQAGINIRHIKNMPPLSFGVSDKEVALTIEKMEGGKMSQSFLISNEPLYVNHFNSLFEDLWKNGVDATDRISDIEAGVDLADIEVIPSSAKAQHKYLNIVRSAKEEILLIFPTTSAFIRQEKIGVIQLAKQAAKERNIKVRILVPINSLIEQITTQLIQHYPNHIDVRYIEQMVQAKATVLVVDKRESMVMELRDDSKTTFIEAIGLSTYSNSKAGVLSYVAIFENLWAQSNLYEQLKRHDKMQKEFINIAAHELRTPIQPILGLTANLLSHAKDTEQAKLLEVVSRNAKRLKRLTEDILDVTKNESQSLHLKKERFNLNDILINSIDDTMSNKQSSKIEKNLIKLQYHQPQDVFVEADKGRISQVIHNLLDNAVKFTNIGTITISIQIKKEDEKGDVVVRVKDTGSGIDPEIIPRLFTKFATKSETIGTGLGLFISKSIVESHGGRIWAESKTDGNGATFCFSLPLSK